MPRISWVRVTMPELEEAFEGRDDERDGFTGTVDVYVPRVTFLSFSRAQDLSPLDIRTDFPHWGEPITRIVNSGTGGEVVVAGRSVRR